MKVHVPLDELLHQNRVELDVNLSSKKSVLERAARLLVRDEADMAHRDIFEALCQRERLGSTGLGHGVAIPHCRIDAPDVAAAFLRLRKPIDFDSPDNQAVDLFFALAVPAQRNESHLQLLAQVAERFSDERIRQELRAAASYQDILELFRGHARAGTG